MMGDDFMFKDFLPEDAGQTFSTLVTRANDWLRYNCDWRVVNCESVEFKYKGDEQSNTEAMVYKEGNTHMAYVRGVRLWLRRSTGERVQQIGYKNVIPELKSSSGCFTSAVYEELGELLVRHNDSMRMDPLPGLILNIETVVIKTTKNDCADPETCFWKQWGKMLNSFLYIICIFYEISEPHYQPIGIADFLPDLVSSSCIGIYNKYESFTKVMEKVSEWSRRQQQLKIVNLQSLAVKLDQSLTSASFKHNSMKMNYYEYGKAATFYLRALRVAFIYIEQPEPIQVPQLLDCRTFSPLQLTSHRMSSVLVIDSTLPKFESLGDTTKKIFEWIKATGAEVLNVETSALRLRSEGADHSADVSLFYNPKETNEFWIYVIRVYVRGRLQQPAQETHPDVQREGCCIV